MTQREKLNANGVLVQASSLLAITCYAKFPQGTLVASFVQERARRAALIAKEQDFEPNGWINLLFPSSEEELTILSDNL